MRNKSNLITKVPLMWLNNTEISKMQKENPDYCNTIAINRREEKSFHDIRKELKLYVVTTDKQYKILAANKKEAIAKLKQDEGVQAKEITRMQVIYEDYTKELKINKRKTQVSQNEKQN